MASVTRATKPSAPVVASPSSSLIIISPLETRTSCGYNYRVVMNATVFPGGNVDTSDHDRASSYEILDPTLDTFKRCAIRETFEETGILITKPRVQFASGDRKKWRSMVHESGRAFPSLLDAYHVNLDLQELVHYANWITPATLPRRYNTNFFLSVVSSSETLPARHDNSETLQISHFTPAEGIEAHRSGKIVLFPPQLYMLHDLSTSKSYEELLEVMRTRAVVPTQPMFKPDLGHIVLPGDEARGGAPGTFNRIKVSVQKGNMAPLNIIRQNLHGFADMLTEEVSATIEGELLKEKL
ncbi:putative NUDIX family hydrolase [Taphrina deformans PYCC 5710]|uniref:NUDIX family hydrolase n=1 Tax=Taphrina deformans (strain PYCC 5710 / ATCC 11124 / CBS 356.35 / IMI 108563 / JCM 9778 / NBRC 8474) TaxID=1097556 RepID=R4X977_TAPDE|nr:putative NUDIX family hydrolase [Taphrina deformans PYCC 5710]|eukprot:CCG82230.1 putative NUDIX family hydrolase [Taphrina deformans PYCC 5710]